MIRALLKWFVRLVVLVLVLIAAAVGWILLRWDQDYSSLPAPAITASSDPAVIARGEYLFHTAAHCSSCHAGPDSPAHKRGDRAPAVGGHVFEAGPFGRFVARNLTADRETGVGAQSDGELARAIRFGVDRNGRLLPFMVLAAGPMSDEDLTAVVSYIRTFPAVRRQEPPERWGFLAKVLTSTRFGPLAGPRPAHVPASDAPSVARGAYLANGPAACRYCHTKHDAFNGFAEAAPPFSGGDVDVDESDAAFEFEPPNLTPDPKSSPIAAWDEATFLTRFRGGLVFRGSHMPWENFAELTDADVRSVYRYLRSLPPVTVAAGPSHRPAGWKPPAS